MHMRISVGYVSTGFLSLGAYERFGLQDEADRI